MLAWRLVVLKVSWLVHRLVVRSEEKSVGK